MKDNFNLIAFFCFWIIFSFIISLKMLGFYFKSISWWLIFSPIILSIFLFLIIFSWYIISELHNYILKSKKGNKK